VKRVRVVVSGRVQGVFFRATCARMARDAGLGGYVLNRSDGSVEAAFEGPGDAVDRMVEWCRTGPDLARVEEVEAVVEEPLGDVTFRVAH
jgi:acylphosphatase